MERIGTLASLISISTSKKEVGTLSTDTNVFAKKIKWFLTEKSFYVRRVAFAGTAKSHGTRYCGRTYGAGLNVVKPLRTSGRLFP